MEIIKTDTVYDHDNDEYIDWFFVDGVEYGFVSKGIPGTDSVEHSLIDWDGFPVPWTEEADEIEAALWAYLDNEKPAFKVLAGGGPL